MRKGPDRSEKVVASAVTVASVFPWTRFLHDLGCVSCVCVNAVVKATTCKGLKKGLYVGAGAYSVKGMTCLQCWDHVTIWESGLQVKAIYI